MSAISAQVLGSSSSYIVSGIPAGTFDTFVSNQEGRATGKEFWDNLSDDGAWNPGTGQGCAIGFYATATMKSDCTSETAGSYTNSLANTLGNAYNYYWNAAAVMPASFEFSAATTYDVTFKAAYSGGMSVVGYYIKTGGAYAFTPVPNWSNKLISNVSMPITAPAGSTWGFFIANNRPGTAGIESSSCGTLPDGGSGTLNVACSDATGGFVTNPFQQFALLGNATGTSYLVGAEDKTVRYSTGPNPLDNDSDYNDYIWAVVPRPIVRTCDFMTFGRTQIDAPLGKIVISGNAGGFKADGSILGTFNISVGGTSYLVQDITSYGPITSGVALVGLSYPNARVITGISRSGSAVEIRIYDGGEPGRVADEVYLKVDGVEVLGASGVSLDRGNIQYHSNCRGPG
ncbi:MAG: hypothetical protein H7305_00035 [Gemmatimonadaceae bacterium]|nr:hypothetical protein [Gemmatimonadaceae bacterium]